MIVCLCRVVSDQKIRECAHAGARTVKAIERACGAGSDCGTCRLQVAAVLREERDERKDPQPACSSKRERDPRAA